MDQYFLILFLGVGRYVSFKDADDSIDLVMIKLSQVSYTSVKVKSSESLTHVFVASDLFHIDHIIHKKTKVIRQAFQRCYPLDHGFYHTLEYQTLNLTISTWSDGVAIFWSNHMCKACCSGSPSEFRRFVFISYVGVCVSVKKYVNEFWLNFQDMSEMMQGKIISEDGGVPHHHPSQYKDRLSQVWGFPCSR